MSARQGPLAGLRGALARLAPPRFVLFVVLLAGVMGSAMVLAQASWSRGFMLGFDSAAVVFVASLWPLSRDHGAAQMRAHAAQNAAGRNLVLAITGVAMVGILAAITAELPPARHGDARAVVELVGSLALAWGFTNCVFMLHYAQACYHRNGAGEPGGQPGAPPGDAGGFQFPATPEPDYWDFLYFSFTAGMSFAASDVNVTRGAVRRIVTLQCLLSFIFNIGVLAFSINVLAGAG